MIWDFNFFFIFGAFYEEMQYIFIRKYTIFIGLSALKITGYDIKSGILYARNKRNLICNSRFDVISGNFEA